MNKISKETQEKYDKLKDSLENRKYIDCVRINSTIFDMLCNTLTVQKEIVKTINNSSLVFNHINDEIVKEFDHNLYLAESYAKMFSESEANQKVIFEEKWSKIVEGKKKEKLFDIISLGELSKLEKTNRRMKAIRELELLFLQKLVEDPQDGTDWDCEFLDKFNEMKIYTIKKIKADGESK